MTGSEWVALAVVAGVIIAVLGALEVLMSRQLDQKIDRLVTRLVDRFTEAFKVIADRSVTELQSSRTDDIAAMEARLAQRVDGHASEMTEAFDRLDDAIAGLRAEVIAALGGDAPDGD